MSVCGSDEIANKKERNWHIWIPGFPAYAGPVSSLLDLSGVGVVEGTVGDRDTSWMQEAE